MTVTSELGFSYEYSVDINLGTAAAPQLERGGSCACGPYAAGCIGGWIEVRAGASYSTGSPCGLKLRTCNSIEHFILLRGVEERKRCERR